MNTRDGLLVNERESPDPVGVNTSEGIRDTALAMTRGLFGKGESRG